MKKLMTTLFAAAAAFGLHAVDQGPISGTSFEGQTAGDYDIYDGTGELESLSEGQTYWVTNETSTLTVIEGTSAEGLLPGGKYSKQPEVFDGEGQYRYLKVKTTLGNAVTRNVNTDGTGTAIGGGIYFDSLVKFTAFDSFPETTLGNDGKLAIWLKEELDANDLPTATNLYISAGYLDADSQDKVIPTNYLCRVDGVNFSDGGWHRVTVKAMNSIYKAGTDAVPGFVVFVDAQYAYCEDEHNTKGITATENLTDTAGFFNDLGALFPSAVQLGNASVKCAISSVSFDGQGEVDDLVFTTKAPGFAKDSEYFTINLDSNIASVTYDDGTGETTIYETTQIDYKQGLSISIVDIQGLTGYMGGDVTFVIGVDTNWVDDVVWYEPTGADQSITVNAKASGAYIVGGDKYETLTDAFNWINGEGSGGSYEVKMTGNLDGSIELTSSGSEVTLDLMGFSITGAVNTAAIYLYDGALTITNSAAPAGGYVVPAAGCDAIEVSYTDALVIGGGVFEGNINAEGAGDNFEITGGAFLISAQNQGVEAILDGAVKAALGDEYGIVEEGLYYVVGAATATKYLVEFLDGGTSVATTNIEENTTLVPPADPAQRAGYTFVGWLTDPEDLESAWDFDDVVTEAMTLTAGWRLDSYTITYLNEDGSAFDEWAEGYSVTNTYTVEDVIVLPTADNVNLGDGGEFKGWTNAVGTAIAGWPAGGMTGAVTVYAKIDAVVPPAKHDAGATILCEDATEAAELAAAITATPAAYVNVPAGVANGAAYCALFRGVADGSNVTIELTADAEAAAQAAADAAAATIPLSAIASGTIGSVVVIDAVPGLYYSLSVGETCTGLVENTPRVLAQDSGEHPNINAGKISLSVGKPSSEATAGFYKVNVNIEPAPQD